jgi:5-oxoprolinase (ATP-hydrolysing)
VNGIAQTGVQTGELEAISMGTTVATNALLRRNGATVIFVTTQGFEDTPHLAHES